MVLVATAVAVVADATTDAASYLERVREKRTLLHIFIKNIIYIDNESSGGTYGRLDHKSDDTL